MRVANIFAIASMLVATTAAPVATNNVEVAVAALNERGHWSDWKREEASPLSERYNTDWKREESASLNERVFPDWKREETASLNERVFPDWKREEAAPLSERLYPDWKREATEESRT